MAREDLRLVVEAEEDVENRVLQLGEVAVRSRGSADGTPEENVGGKAAALIDEKRDVVLAVAGRLEGPDTEPSARDLVAVGEL